jgi:hypothetical protein
MHQSWDFSQRFLQAFLALEQFGAVVIQIYYPVDGLREFLSHFFGKLHRDWFEHLI